MSTALEKYVRLFGKLRTDKNSQRWTAQTHFRAPHKPLLLLAVIDRFADGELTQNLIQPTPELAQDFLIYWKRVMPPSAAASYVLPFFHLQGDGFWHLRAVEGKADTLSATKQMKYASQLVSMVQGATLDADLYDVLCTAEGRAVLSQVLMDTYFVEELRPLVREQSEINTQARTYCRQLLAHDTSHGPTLPRAARKQGFRRAVVWAYERRCAFCGIRLITPDGRVVVDAAHIIPWKVTHNDDPQNGLALCKLCHWTFDEGLVTVTSAYLLKGSEQLRFQPNLPAQIISLTDRLILKPDNQSYWPDAEAFAWHREHRFLKP